jgi:hypothetical protein
MRSTNTYQLTDQSERALPFDLDKQAQAIESEGWIHYLMKRFEKAEEFYRRDLDLRYEYQKKSGAAVHKGAPRQNDETHSSSAIFPT